jgi:hypothetical protein
MAKTRATCKLTDLLDEVNRRNRESTCPREMRAGWNSLLEFALSEAGAYAGYGFLGPKDVPVNEKPGIIVNEPAVNEFPDDSRRFYHIKRVYSRVGK